MVEIKLNKHEAKILERLLKSDKKDFLETLHHFADKLDDEYDVVDSNFGGKGKKSYPNLSYHTTDAVVVINAVLRQL